VVVPYNQVPLYFWTKIMFLRLKSTYFVARKSRCSLSSSRSYWHCVASTLINVLKESCCSAVVMPDMLRPGFNRLYRLAKQWIFGAALQRASATAAAGRALNCVLSNTFHFRLSAPAKCAPTIRLPRLLDTTACVCVCVATVHKRRRSSPLGKFGFTAPLFNLGASSYVP